MIDVEKNGEVYVVYVSNIRTKETNKIPSYGAKVAGFPQTLVGLGALQAFLPGEEFNFVEEVKEVPAQVAEGSQSHNKGIAGASIRLKQSKPGDTEQLALHYFHRLMDRLNYCSDERAEQVKIQVRVVGEFILELWPHLAPDLDEIKLVATEGRFKL